MNTAKIQRLLIDRLIVTLQLPDLQSILVLISQFIHPMRSKPLHLLLLLTITLLLHQTHSVMTRKILEKKYPTMASSEQSSPLIINQQPLNLSISTQCNKVDLSGQYNYNGIVRSGYLSVGFGGSALSFIFYGKSDINDPSQLKNIPTIIYLNGGPGFSSQLGNLQEIGPLLLKKKSFSVDVALNQNSWVKKYNLLFVDQPVGTGLSYADPSSSRPFAASLDDVANDFYYALNQLYNTMDGCFNSRNLNIPSDSPLFIFGQGYGGKYASAIAKKIVEQKENGNGFLKGLKGVGIINGFNSPYLMLSEVGNFAFHLSLLDYQQRMKIETILLRASKNNGRQNYSNLHEDFHQALDQIVEKAGDINVFDIKFDGQYEQFLQPYFRDPHNIKLYGLNGGVVFDSQSGEVYKKMQPEFMKNEADRVEYLLNKNVPVLVCQGQDDLITQNPGTMKWVDRLRHQKGDEFRESLFRGWKINDKMVGSIKSAGNLQLRIVNNAGHMLGMDNPRAALDLAVSFVQKNK